MSKTGFNIFSHLARLCDVCPVVWVAAIKHQCPHVNIRRRDLTPQSATVLNGVFLSVAVHLWMILRRMIILDASGINILERGIEIEMREEKEEERTRSPIRITIPYCLHTHTTIPLPTFPQGPSTILTKRHSLCTLMAHTKHHLRLTIQYTHTHHTHTHTHTYTHTPQGSCTATCAYLDGIYKRASVPVQRRVKVT